MAHIRAAGRSVIDAPPAVVYGIIADYREGHPSILPERYFGPLTVERGGTGDGTEIRFTMRSFGRTTEVRGVVTEPEPGRVLVETYPGTGIVTTFTVDPLDGGSRSDVLITTEWEEKGLKGAILNLIVPGHLGRVYRAELEKLALVAAGRVKR